MDYTEKLQKEIERVTLRGNADKDTIRVLASIIYDMNLRIEMLTAKPAKPVQVAAPKPEPVAEPTPVEPAGSSIKKALEPTPKSKG